MWGCRDLKFSVLIDLRNIYKVLRSYLCRMEDNMAIVQNLDITFHLKAVSNEQLKVGI
jgi:hypothetical protein